MKIKLVILLCLSVSIYAAENSKTDLPPSYAQLLQAGAIQQYPAPQAPMHMHMPVQTEIIMQEPAPVSIVRTQSPPRQTEPRCTCSCTDCLLCFLCGAVNAAEAPSTCCNCLCGGCTECCAAILCCLLS